MSDQGDDETRIKMNENEVSLRVTNLMIAVTNQETAMQQLVNDIARLKDSNLANDKNFVEQLERNVEEWKQTIEISKEVAEPIKQYIAELVTQHRIHWVPDDRERFAWVGMYNKDMSAREVLDLVYKIPVEFLYMGPEKFGNMLVNEIREFAEYSTKEPDEILTELNEVKVQIGTLIARRDGLVKRLEDRKNEVDSAASAAHGDDENKRKKQ